MHAVLIIRTSPALKGTPAAIIDLAATCHSPTVSKASQKLN